MKKSNAELEFKTIIERKDGDGLGSVDRYFDEDVNHHFAQGWRPCGGVFLMEYTDWHGSKPYRHLCVIRRKPPSGRTESPSSTPSKKNG
jgi:hypothetical protein